MNKLHNFINHSGKSHCFSAFATTLTLLISLSGSTILSSCSAGRWTDQEKALICDGPTVMKVLSIDNPDDTTVLRRQCIDLSDGQIRSSIYKKLADCMISTVTDPSQDGVGIAGPQVGISRRVVAVRRFDKDGEPFEVYPNIRITAMRGEPVSGPEGCLSIPDRRADVLRSRDIDIAYTSPTSLRDTTENIKGFTAVIFQHECDHLDGIVFTDRLWSQSDSWYSCPDNTVDSSFVDAFYIVSTDVLESHTADGEEVYNSVLDSAERAALEAEMNYVHSHFFPDSINYYSPFYHQVTMNGFNASPDNAQTAYRRATLDIFDAFDWYMKNENGGRRFIIAGFSQGAMLVKELLTHMSDGQYSRLVAAYIIGYGLDSTDITHPHIVPAKGEGDTGVSISFNSVRDTSSIWNLVYHNAAVCINPVNWRTDSTPARFTYKGNDLEVTLDTERHLLIVPEFVDEATPFWPVGCLHHYDLLFYSNSIGRNALYRAYGRH